MCTAVIASSLCLLLARPKVTNPLSVTVRAGSEMVNPISCSATGFGTIYYKWEKYESSDNSWTTPSHRAVNIITPKLIFNVITEEDEGVYHCIVSNYDGIVVSDNATITVYGMCQCIVLLH